MNRVIDAISFALLGITNVGCLATLIIDKGVMPASTAHVAEPSTVLLFVGLVIATLRLAARAAKLAVIEDAA